MYSTAATSVLYPVFWILWEILYAPIRIVAGLCSLVASICNCIYDLIGDIWLSVSSIFQVASSAEATVKTYEVSIWRSLWNDLFSQVISTFNAIVAGNIGYLNYKFVLTIFWFPFQVFRAVRSILHGFVAFFTACNRHRLRFDLFLLYIITYFFNLQNILSSAASCLYLEP